MTDKTFGFCASTVYVFIFICFVASKRNIKNEGYANHKGIAQNYWKEAKLTNVMLIQEKKGGRSSSTDKVRGTQMVLYLQEI